jgi:hypothetical protein
MLHERLADYLAEVEAAVRSLADGYVERYEEEILTPERVNLRLRIRFASGYLLEISEAVVVAEDALQTLGYRYHCQDGNQALAFRYDDTPHFPNLASFPHHKHVPDHVIAAAQPALGRVIEEAAALARPLPDQPPSVASIFD